MSALVTFGCGTVQERQYYAVTEVRERQVELEPERALRIEELSFERDVATVQVTETAICRKALEREYERDLVTERYIVRKWLTPPAPANFQSSGAKSLGRALAVVAYAATFAVFDHIRTPTTREPAEPEIRRDALQQTDCGTIPAARRTVELELYLWRGSRPPTFAYGPLGPILHVERREVQTDSQGRVTFRGLDTAAIPRPHASLAPHR